MIGSYVDLGNPVSDHPLNQGLVSWWLGLPNWSGGYVWPDLCCRNNGTLTAGPTWKPASRVGGMSAADFDGSDDYISIPANPSLNNISTAVTVSAWVYPRKAFNTNYAIYEKSIGGTVNKQFLLFNDNADCITFRVVIGGALKNVVGTNTQPLTQYAWSHVLGTYVSGDMRLYLNGRQIASSTAHTGSIDTGSGESKIGALFTAGFFNDGRIDDVRILNRSVSASEAGVIYNQSRYGHPDTLRRWSRKTRLFGAVPATGNRRRRVICGS